MFRTLDGLRVVSLSVEQMREADRIAMDGAGPSLRQMMENAGAILAEFAREQWPRAMVVGPVVVLAGAGHNGGGGICCAYHLLCQGANVQLYVGDDVYGLEEATTAQLKRFQETGGMVMDTAQMLELRPFLIIDALIGYGLHGAPRERTADLINWANACTAPVLSLDVPSGLNADSGETPGACIQAAKTVTLALPKRGLTAACAGELWLADIGIPEAAFHKAGLDVKSPFAGTAKIRLRIQRDASPIFPGAPLC